MRPAAALLASIALLATGCGGEPDSPESVVRAWSHAVNSGDNERAASLFAEGADVVQGGRVLELATRADAVAWNSALPCSGRIVSLRTAGQTVTATFRLADRGSRACDGPGERATAVIEIEDGKIVLWHQVAAPRPGPADVV